MFSFFGRKKPPTGPGAQGRRKLYIPENLYQRMLNHCREEKPLEACGLLVGAAGHVSTAYAADNLHRSPVLYQVDERQLLQALREIQSDRQELVAIYHSHVTKPAVPSQTDIDQATWPEAFYVIVSLAGKEPVVRAWRIVDRQVTEHPVVRQRETDGAWRDLRAAVRAAAEQQPRPGETPPPRDNSGRRDIP